MNGSLKLALFILAVGVNILGSCADPCAGDGGGIPGPPSEPGKPTRCRELGGYCYNALCKNCTDGHIRTDLCGDDENENRKCCLPGPPPPYVCCEIFSDPHIRSFDGKYFDVQVVGGFVISEPCNSQTFRVQADFALPHPGAIWTRVNTVQVLAGANDIVMFSNGNVEVNSSPVTLPHQIANTTYEVFMEGPNVYVKLTDLGVLICFNQNTKRLTVYVRSSYEGTLCGLCGNYNLDSRDDGLDAPALPAATQRCPNPRTHDDWNQCRRQLNTILSDCPNNIPFQRYLEACAFDMCAGGRDAASLSLDAARESCNSDVADKINPPV